jgi:hypothetical protein
MKAKGAGTVLGAVVCLLSLFLPLASPAQTSAAGLSGTVKNASGGAVAGAQVSARETPSGKTTRTLSGPDGRYNLPDLEPGAYEVSVTADGFAAAAAKATVTGKPQPALDFVMNSPAPPVSQPGQAGQSTSANLPNAPTSAPPSPSLGDLGFSSQQTQANPQLQALLDKRTHMLKVHQRLGLITAIPMAATLITGGGAKALGRPGQPIREPTTANLDFHVALGGVTTALYAATAYYAIFAPRAPDTKKRGAIRVHEALTFIHGPGMILTPVLGIMAYKQETAGEKVHGIAAAHGPVADVTALAYGASIIAVSWPIHLKFWKGQ